MVSSFMCALLAIKTATHSPHCTHVCMWGLAKGPISGSLWVLRPCELFSAFMGIFHLHLMGILKGMLQCVVKSVAN